MALITAVYSRLLDELTLCISAAVVPSSISQPCPLLSELKCIFCRADIDPLDVGRFAAGPYFARSRQEVYFGISGRNLKPDDDD